MQLIILIKILKGLVIKSELPIKQLILQQIIQSKLFKKIINPLSIEAYYKAEKEINDDEFLFIKVHCQVI